MVKYTREANQPERVRTMSGRKRRAAAATKPVSRVYSTTLPTSINIDAAKAHLTKVDPALGRVIQAHPDWGCPPFAGHSGDTFIFHPFRSLITSIVYQQLNGRVAQIILKRFIALFAPATPSKRRRLSRVSRGSWIIVNERDETTLPEESETEAEELHAPDAFFPSPEMVAERSADELKGAGLSLRKAEYILAIANAALNGELDPTDLAALSDEELHARLCAIRGIGPWTVDMFLLFAAKRPDVLPVGDLAIRKAMSAHFKMKAPSKAKPIRRDGVYMPKAEELQAAAEKWRPYRSVACWYMWRFLGTLTV